MTIPRALTPLLDYVGAARDRLGARRSTGNHDLNVAPRLMRGKLESGKLGACGPISRARLLKRAATKWLRLEWAGSQGLIRSVLSTEAEA